MPRKPQRPCRYPGCPHLTDGVYCEEHAKVMEQHYEKFQRGYSPGKRYGRAWKRIRDRYVHKHPLCEQCLKEGRYVAVEEVHHIVPLADGGSNDESNLMSLCRSCHEKIHRERGDREGGQNLYDPFPRKTARGLLRKNCNSNRVLNPAPQKWK